MACIMYEAYHIEFSKLNRTCEIFSVLKKYHVKNGRDGGPCRFLHVCQFFLQIPFWRKRISVYV